MDLVTGFPGFIGRRLVAELLREGEGDDGGASAAAGGGDGRVVCVVEERMFEAARAAAAALPGGERVEVVAGDIVERRLGLSPAYYDRLTSEVRRVFHLAAIYDLAVPIEIAQRVNVDGTGNVLELCGDASSLERLVYVSTAYVAGLRTQIVYEHELGMGQGFKNHYESTKFQAEVWVERERGEIPTTILRPAIVVGDSRTGETAKFDGPYYLLRTIAQLRRRRLPVAQFGRSEAAFNVVPVDYVVAAMVEAAKLDGALGETLHLVDPQPLTTRELVTTLAREYDGTVPRGALPPGLAAVALRSPAVRRLFDGTPRESIAYLNHPVTFDSRRTVDLLGPRGLTPPRFAEYAPAMVRFFAEHATHPAFRSAGMKLD